jgi:hypothetical protein
MRALILALGCLVWLTSAALAAGPDRLNEATTLLDREAMRFETAPQAGDGGPPSFILVVAPEFYYGSYSSLETTLAGTHLSSEGGDNTGVGLTFQLTKPFNEIFSLSLIYQWSRSEVEGGSLFPTALAPLYGWTKQHSVSHMAGLIGTINLGRYGKLEPSLLFGFDNFGGTESVINRATGDREDSQTALAKDMATSLMVFYSIDLPVTDSLVLTPYLGWRSVFVTLDYRTQADDSGWAHLLSGGLSAKWSTGPITLIARAGFNHRVSKNDVPGLSTRAVAPGVTHVGWNTSFDRTVATYGLALDWAFGPGVLELSYDGMAGADTTYHKGALVLIFPF